MGNVDVPAPKSDNCKIGYIKNNDDIISRIPNCKQVFKRWVETDGMGEMFDNITYNTGKSDDNHLFHCET